MATYIQRWTALCESLLNAPPSTAQMTRLGEAIADANGNLAVFTAMTNAQKAEYCLKYARQYFVGLVKQKDNMAAIRTANEAAAGVDTEFAEV